jgi:hypothetical protein
LIIRIIFYISYRPHHHSYLDIVLAWDEFTQYLKSDTPPPLTERDSRVRDDEVWREAAQRYLEAKNQAEVCAAALDDAKAALVSLATHPSESGCGVSVSQFWKRGSVAYGKVPALKDMDLETYRGPSRMETRVSVG